MTTKEVAPVAKRRPPAAGMGRKKGTPNKTTALLKDAILMAADAAHKEGLVGYLTVQATKNPGPFMTLLGRVLPTQLTGDPTNPVVMVGGDASTPARARALAAFLARTRAEK